MPPGRKDFGGLGKMLLGLANPAVAGGTMNARRVIAGKTAIENVEPSGGALRRVSVGASKANGFLQNCLCRIQPLRYVVFNHATNLHKFAEIVTNYFSQSS